jgi:cyclopropane-fatty-acyl-phospholipid synthase
VRVIGLTLSREQFHYVEARASEWGGEIDVRLQGWEEFDEPVDRIVSIGAFEHFRQERYGPFFEKCRRLLPRDGRMLLHTIVWPEIEHFVKLGSALTPEDLDFFRFINREIFPHGQLSAPSLIRRSAQGAGFRIIQERLLQPHYARTLDCWADNLRRSREEAIELTSIETYETYLRYLTGCAHYYRREIVDLVQFTLAR